MLTILFTVSGALSLHAQSPAAAKLKSGKDPYASYLLLLNERPICIIEYDEKNTILIVKNKAGKVNVNLSERRSFFK
jgi:hypothetical protein